MDTETIDKLYLELSQFTSARPKREQELETELQTLKASILSLLPHSAECLLTDTDGKVIPDSDGFPIFLNNPCNCPLNIQSLRELAL